MDKCLPFAGVNTTIRVFRQALALDEVGSDNINRFLFPFSVPPTPSASKPGVCPISFSTGR